MSDAHADQRVDDITASLLSAGIGTAYHRRHLSEVAPSLIDAAKSSLLAGVREGRGLTIVGHDTAYDTAVLLARALHLQGVGTLVVPLRRLVKWLEFDGEEALRANQVHALFVLGFQDSGDNPMVGWQVQDVQNLLNDRIDSARATFPQVSHKPSRVGWWPETLVRRLNRLNSTFEC